MLEKTIRDFIKPGRAPRLSPDDTVATATELMRTQRAECIAVVEGDKLLGVFTERDFLNRASHLTVTQTRMREVMTPDPITLGADDSISYAINKMAAGGFRNVPIVDAEGRLIEVLNVRDVINHLSELFAALAEQTDGDPTDSKEWEDIGGGA